jgi:hypothetical protein
MDNLKPTHVLVVEIPLNLDFATEPNFDPFQDALKIVLALSRLAVAKVACDNPTVTVRSAE